MRRIKAAAVFVAVLAGGLVVTGAPASASYQEGCFGQAGIFKDGTVVMHADWNNDGYTDECIGIAPDRTIWHAWRTSQRWEQLGRKDARADCTTGTTGVSYLDLRTVNVAVFGKGTWSIDFNPDDGWGAWHKTSDNVVCY